MKHRLGGTKMIELKTKIPGPKSQKLMAQRLESVARGPFHSTPIFISKSHGAIIEDVDGNHLIDFASGIGVTSVGHTPQELSKAIAEQATQFIHAGFNVTPYESYIKLAEKLNAAVPGKYPKKTLLVNSGAEAVENAIKFARTFTKRQAVICFEHGFHGRTYMAMTLTSKVKPYKAGFGPFNPEVYRAPFPYAYRWATTSDSKVVSDECFAKFTELVQNQIGPENIAAVIIEPVLGEGGFVPAPQEFLEKLRNFCTENKTVLIADEIQSGFGRTGTFLACEQLGLTPDLVTMAKGIAGGMPLAAVTGRADIMDSVSEGGVGGTYGGNPVACAAALKVFEMVEKDLLSKSRSLGALVHERLTSMKTKYSVIGDVRGLGPMQALEFVKDQKSKEPNKELVGKITKYCYEHGLVVMSAGTYGNVVRLLPPLIIDTATANEGLDVLEEAIKVNSK
jgi:4-aminobutyrate aminotransferase / (S)-3-amino-2-methylpropionate transaminase / 5-aminovalerate transaminase